jgi:phage tail-like protein
MGTGFPKNAHRFDPYKTFKFRVEVDGKEVLGVNKVGAIKRTTQVVKYQSAGQNGRETSSPGRTTYDAITLERGKTQDMAFHEWANRVHSDSGGDKGMDLVNYKRDLALIIMTEKGHPAIRYNLYNCWVSEYTAFPNCDAGANSVAIESIKLEVEYWERDDSVKEPDESVPVS